MLKRTPVQQERASESACEGLGGGKVISLIVSYPKGSNI